MHYIYEIYVYKHILVLVLNGLCSNIQVVTRYLVGFIIYTKISNWGGEGGGGGGGGGGGMAYGGLPFPDTSCPVSDVYIYYVPDD